MGALWSAIFGGNESSESQRTQYTSSPTYSYDSGYSARSSYSYNAPRYNSQPNVWGCSTEYSPRSNTTFSPIPSQTISSNYTLAERQLINEKYEVEKRKNVFSSFYEKPFKKPADLRKPTASGVQAVLESYKHTDAIKFAATSYVWMTSYHANLKVLPKTSITQIPSYAVGNETFAYYCVIADRGNKYTLVACHVNVHGYHRGDLRFVEVTDRTVTKGFEDYSVVGKMYLGDIVAVTELARCSKISLEETELKSMKRINQETECCWAVKTMTLLTKRISTDITFAFLENGNAVAKGFDEMMTVVPNSRVKLMPDTLYTGTAFIPGDTEFTFTMDHEPKHKNALIAKASQICSYPKAFGTIFSYEESDVQSSFFDVGFNAFLPKESWLTSTSEQIVETCSLMGYSAAVSIFNGRFDCRSFPMRNPQQQGQIVKFMIDNPKELPTEGRWSSNNRIEIECGGDFRRMTGCIESVTAVNGGLQVVARLSRDAPRRIDFQSVIPIVRQRAPMESSKISNGFFAKMDRESNGRRIIETLYGGNPMKQTSRLPFQQFHFDGVAMNKYQCEYVSMMLAETPLVLGSSPFGCGKSMTIVATAVEVFKSDPKVVPSVQLLITQSNYASVNLVDIAKKVTETEMKFVRFVSETNWKELPDNCRTSYDIPALMSDVCTKWALGGYPEEDNELLQNRHMVNMVYFVINRQLLMPDELSGQARSIYDRLGGSKKPWMKDVTEAFFLLYRPNVVMTTADSLQTLLTSKAIRPGSVSTIQIDEASQVPEYTLISLLSSFPDACFGLIGDIKQLPPYCEDLLKGKLKDYGVGNTMERAVEGSMFPQAVLRYVYRCHPAITELLSDLFYEGQLISGVKETDRNQFITKRSDFWPNNKFPIIIVDNQEKARKMGTSWSNQGEAALVKQYVELVSKKCNGYQLKKEQIGVISFYSAQTSVLTEQLRGSGVKCGTVDAFQGTEREVVILCCTNEKLSDFMQLANRLNVAMSRARQATIVIGNVEGLRKANFWSTVVQKAQQNGCLLQQTRISQNPANFIQRNQNQKKQKGFLAEQNKKDSNKEFKQMQKGFGKMKIKK